MELKDNVFVWLEAEIEDEESKLESLEEKVTDIERALENAEDEVRCLTRDFEEASEAKDNQQELVDDLTKLIYP